MLLKKISKDSPDKPTLDKINTSSFNKEQITSIDDLYASDSGDLDILGIYYRGELIGFFSVRLYKSIAYLGYFAIAQEQRSKGLGSRAINLLKDYYGDMQIVIEIESLYEEYDNIENRIRRKNFYIRNGMISTEWYLYYDDVELEILCSDKEFRKNEFVEITEQIHSKYYDFIPELYQKTVNENSDFLRYIAV